jgi:hypothetical protein
VSILIFSVLTLYRAGIFVNEPLVMNDYPYLFYRAWLVNDILIPKYGNIIGWIPYFQAGYVELYDYPPGIFLLTYLIKHITLGFSTLMSFRIVAFLSFILSILAIFLFSYKFTKSLWAGVMSSAFWVAWTHYYFIEGPFPYYYSLAFLLFSLVSYKTWHKTKKLKFFLLTSLFSGLTILFHPAVFFHLIILIFIFHLIYFKKQKLIYFLVLILISVSISSIYFAEGIKGLDYSESSWEKQINAWGPQIFDASNVFLNDYLYQTTIPFFLSVFGISTLYLMKKKISEDYMFVITNILLTIIMMFAVNFLLIFYFRFPINILRPGRISFILRIFIITCASGSLVHVFSALDMKKLTNKLITGLIVSLVLIFLFSNLLYFYNVLTASDFSQVKKVYWGNEFQQIYQLNFTKGIFRFEPKKGFLELVDWLNSKDIKSRVLIEDSTSRSLGGHVTASLPLFTNKTFIGGPYPTIQTAEYDRNIYEGIFFGKSIKNFTYEDFEERLNDFNVKYMVVWSDEATEFLSKGKNFDEIFVTSDKLFRIFEYKTINESYSYQDLDIKVELPYIRISSNKTLNQATIKFSYDKNWNPSNNVEKDNKSFIVIKDLNQNVTLKYTPSIYENICLFITIISLIVLLVAIIWTSL